MVFKPTKVFFDYKIIMIKYFIKEKKTRRIIVSFIISLYNWNYITSVKKCWRESCIIGITSAKMEFALAIFKKLYFSKYSIKKGCKQISSIQKLVWPYK